MRLELRDNNSSQFSPLHTSLWLLGLLLFTFCPASAQTPLTVEEAIQVALKNGQSARVAQASYDVAKVKLEREKPTGTPLLTGIIGETLQSYPKILPIPGEPSALIVPSSSTQATLLLEQVLYHPGLKEARTRYNAQVGGADWDYLHDLHEVVRTVRKAFVDVQRAQAGTHIAQEGLAAAERYQTLVKRQIEAGLARPVDTFTADSQIAEAKAGLHRAENELTLAWLNFNRLLARSDESEVSLVASQEQREIPAKPDTSIQNALAKRPDIKMLERNIEAAKTGIVLAKLQSSPTLSLRGQFSQQTPTALLPQNYMGITLEVRFPLSDGGKTRQDTLEAKSQTKRLEALMEEAKQGIRMEVRQAWLKLAEANEAIQVANTQRKEADNLLMVAEKAYEVNRGTALEVKEAQRRWREAMEKQNLANAESRLSWIEFDHACGETLVPLNPTTLKMQLPPTKARRK